MGDAATSVRGRRAAGAVERRRHRYGPVAVWPGLEGDRGTRHWSGTVVDRRRPAIAGRAQGIEQRQRPADGCGTVRSEKRGVGKECVSLVRSGGSRDNKKKK